MKIKLLSAFSFQGGSFGASETVDVDNTTAYRLVKKGLAEAVDKKGKDLIARLEKEEKARKEREALEQAKLEREAIELELNALYEQVVEKEALLAGVKLTKKQKDELIEGLKNREIKVTE